MNNILTEKQYQRYIIDCLIENGYLERKADNYDPAFAIDRELLFKFLYETQPEKWRLLKRYTRTTCAKRL